MPPSRNSAPSPLPAGSNQVEQSQQSADLVYQAVTIAAILILLGSLWAF